MPLPLNANTFYFVLQRFSCENSEECERNYMTEKDLYNVIDEFAAYGIDYAKPAIYYFSGRYSSGLNSDWPMHTTTMNNGNSQQAHDVRMTSDQRRCDVMTSHRR